MVVKRRLRDLPDWQTPPAAEDTPCPLCGRPLPAGPSVDEHHLVPRSQGGRHAERVHRICHRKIHATFSEKTLAREFSSWEALRQHPVMAEFIRWVANKPPAFYRRNATSHDKA